MLTACFRRCMLVDLSCNHLSTKEVKIDLNVRGMTVTCISCCTLLYSGPTLAKKSNDRLARHQTHYTHGSCVFCW